MDLVTKLALGQPITDKDLEDALYQTCEDVHASCDETCPVYHLNGRQVPNTTGTRWGCDTFKDGAKMLAFIRNSNM